MKIIPLVSFLLLVSIARAAEVRFIHFDHNSASYLFEVISYAETDAGPQGEITVQKVSSPTSGIFRKEETISMADFYVDDQGRSWPTFYQASVWDQTGTVMYYATPTVEVVPGGRRIVENSSGSWVGRPGWWVGVGDVDRSVTPSLNSSVVLTAFLAGLGFVVVPFGIWAPIHMVRKGIRLGVSV